MFVLKFSKNTVIVLAVLLMLLVALETRAGSSNIPEPAAAVQKVSLYYSYTDTLSPSYSKNFTVTLNSDLATRQGGNKAFTAIRISPRTITKIIKDSSRLPTGTATAKGCVGGNTQRLTILSGKKLINKSSTYNCGTSNIRRSRKVAQFIALYFNLAPSSTAPNTSVPSFSKIIGKTMEEASQEVASTGFSIRPININGEDLIVTQDFNSTRINVTVVDNIITAYSCCG